MTTTTTTTDTTPVLRESTAELSYYDLRAMAALITAVDRRATVAWVVDSERTLVGYAKVIAMRGGDSIIDPTKTPTGSDDIVADGWVILKMRVNNVGPEMNFPLSVQNLLYSLQTGTFVIDPNLSQFA